MYIHESYSHSLYSNFPHNMVSREIQVSDSSLYEETLYT